MFPWWCRIIAWVVLWIGVLVSTAFVLMYSIQFGNDKTSSWLTSIVVSFVSSILITQPIKVTNSFAAEKTVCIELFAMARFDVISELCSLMHSGSAGSNLHVPGNKVTKDRQ